MGVLLKPIGICSLGGLLFNKVWKLHEYISMLIATIKVNGSNYTTDCISVYFSPSSIYLHFYCTLGTELMARNVSMNKAVSAQPVLCVTDA